MIVRVQLSVRQRPTQPDQRLSTDPDRGRERRQVDPPRPIDQRRPPKRQQARVELERSESRVRRAIRIQAENRRGRQRGVGDVGQGGQGCGHENPSVPLHHQEPNRASRAKRRERTIRHSRRREAPHRRPIRVRAGQQHPPVGIHRHRRHVAESRSEIEPRVPTSILLAQPKRHPGRPPVDQVHHTREQIHPPATVMDRTIRTVVRHRPEALVAELRDLETGCRRSHANRHRRAGRHPPRIGNLHRVLSLVDRLDLRQLQRGSGCFGQRHAVPHPLVPQPTPGGRHAQHDVAARRGRCRHRRRGDRRHRVDASGRQKPIPVARVRPGIRTQRKPAPELAHHMKLVHRGHHDPFDFQRSERTILADGRQHPRMQHLTRTVQFRHEQPGTFAHLERGPQPRHHPPRSPRGIQAPRRIERHRTDPTRPRRRHPPHPRPFARRTQSAHETTDHSTRRQPVPTEARRPAKPAPDMAVALGIDCHRHRPVTARSAGLHGPRDPSRRIQPRHERIHGGRFVGIPRHRHQPDGTNAKFSIEPPHQGRRTPGSHGQIEGRHRPRARQALPPHDPSFRVVFHHEHPLALGGRQRAPRVIPNAPGEFPRHHDVPGAIHPQTHGLLPLRAPDAPCPNELASRIQLRHERITSPLARQPDRPEIHGPLEAAGQVDLPRGIHGDIQHRIQSRSTDLKAPLHPIVRSQHQQEAVARSRRLPRDPHRGRLPRKLPDHPSAALAVHGQAIGDIIPPASAGQHLVEGKIGTASRQDPERNRPKTEPPGFDGGVHDAILASPAGFSTLPGPALTNPIRAPAARAPASAGPTLPPPRPPWPRAATRHRS